MERKKSAIFQLSLLAVIQWLSIVVIILNTSALNSMKNSSDRQSGSADAVDGPSFRDFASLILGALSLIVASLLLCLYLHLSLGLVINSNHPIHLSKRLLAGEIFASVSIIALWTVVSGVVFSRFHEMPACQNIDTSLTAKVSFLAESWNNDLDAKTCNTANAMITTGLVTICVWMIVLILSIYMYYYQLCKGSANNLLTSTFSVHPFYEQSKNHHNLITANSRQPAGSVREKYSPIINLQATIVTKSSSNDALTDKLNTTTLANNYHNNRVSDKAPTVVTNNDMFLNDGAATDEEGKGGTFKNTERGIPSLNFTNQFIEEEQSAFYAQEQHMKVPEPPSSSATTTARKYWDYFQFEPVNLNLMLPTPHELIGERKHDSFYYYS